METFAPKPESTSGFALKILIAALAIGIFTGTGCLHKRRVSLPLAASCSAYPAEVLPGEPVTVSAVTSSLKPKHTVTYHWASTGGKITSNDNAVTIDTTGLAGGSYVVTARIIDASGKKNHEASCSANFGVKEPPKNSPVISCSANPPYVLPGNPVTITCTCTSPDGVPLQIGGWTATGGSISGSGTSATLNTTGTVSGTLTVSAVCTDSHGLSQSASIEVSVEVPPPPPPPTLPPPPILETGRDYLLPGDKEKTGYGLYSYLLWWDTPPKDDRSRFINVVSAFLSMPKIAAVEGTEKVASSSGSPAAPAEKIPRENLNLAYLPVTTRPPDGASAEWIVDHYDIVRARALLRRLPRRYRTGPYIISTLKPLHGDLSANEHYLFQNLSAHVITPELADAWIRNFQQMATNKEFWKPLVMRDFVLTLRSMVAELGEDIPIARKGVATWISWLSPPKPATAPVK